MNPSPRQALEQLLDLVGPPRLRCCPLTPISRQEAFLRLQVAEVLYGGAAGGGKTIALLMAALQYADVPGYNALLVRPSLTEFELPGGLIDLSHQWLGGTRAVWSADNKIWRFPGRSKTGAGGASVHFGFLDGGKDVSRYAGSSFSFLGFDELVRFAEQDYRRMFRVLRQADAGGGLLAAPDGTTLADVPVRTRATSNPGGANHTWVKARFVDPETRHEGVIFLPSRLEHNPHLDYDAYSASLDQLPPSERARLLNGDWEIPDEGELFQREWFEVIDRSALPEKTRAVRFWDLAATEPGPASPDPDYTVGLRLDLDEKSGVFFITDIVRARKAPGAIENLVAATAMRDGQEVQIVIEQEPGASGVTVVNRYKAHVLRGYQVKSVRPTGKKEVRARVVAAAAEHGLVKVVTGPHTLDLLDELCSFPHGGHDDCVDALAGAHHEVSRRHGRATYSVPRGNIDSPIRRREATRPPRSAREALLRIQREQAATERLAAGIGLPYYDSQRSNL